MPHTNIDYGWYRYDKSKLPLLLWFKAIRILIQDEMNYSIQEFASLLGVNYRTAKLILEKLQLALHKQ